MQLESEVETTKTAGRRTLYGILLVTMFQSQAGISGTNNRLRPVGYLQLAENVRDVVLHGFHAEQQAIGDLRVAVTLSEQVQDLPLAIRELGESQVCGRWPERGKVVGTETVLLVEDEEAVRTLAARVLRTLGYTVLEATTGAEALTMATVFAASIHLLITDVVMPELGGKPLPSSLPNRSLA